MSQQAIRRSTKRQKPAKRVRPSIVEPASAKPFTLDQELEPFGRWGDKSIWVPPKDSSKAMAQTMLKNHGWLTSSDQRWSSVVAEHRAEFTQVREIELGKASIRLPLRRIFRGPNATA